MPIRRILLLGDPLLRMVSAPLRGAATAGEVLADLRDTLHEFQRTHGFGRGISAVQIGSLERVIYMEFQGTAYCLINPKYVARSEEKFELWDDCFSFPDLLVRLRRSTRVTLEYLDGNGALRTLEASDALSELVQHEMDHLDGVLAIDHAQDLNSLCLREEWLRRYAPDRKAAASNEV